MTARTTHYDDDDDDDGDGDGDGDDDDDDEDDDDADDDDDHDDDDHDAGGGGGRGGGDKSEDGDDVTNNNLAFPTQVVSAWKVDDTLGGLGSMMDFRPQQPRVVGQKFDAALILLESVTALSGLVPPRGESQLILESPTHSYQNEADISFLRALSFSIMTRTMS